jgi:hypothetical protein
VLLNGWKEIAAYLRCGVRTVQRWEQLGLPVARVRPGKRGPVVARSESLDKWIARTRTHPLPPNLEATFQRTFTIRDQMINQLRVFLKNEVATGIILANLAVQARDPDIRKRRITNARRAYNTIMRLGSGMTLPSVEIKSLAAELDELRVALRKLGEKI